MHIKKKFFFLIGIAAYFHYLLAGAAPIEISSWTTPADVKKMIVADGYLWVAGGGLVQYDIATGKSKKYTVQQGLAANGVFDVAVDVENHCAWAATTSGLGHLNMQTDHWLCFGKSAGLDDIFLLSICNYPKVGTHSQTILFIGTRTGGIYMLPKDNRHLIPVLDKKKLPDPRISCIAADPSRHALWLGTPAGVVCCISKNDAFLKIDSPQLYPGLSARCLMVAERTGDVFCLTNYNEFFQFKSDLKEWTKLPVPDGPVKIKEILLSWNNTMENTMEIIWAATDKGIFQYRLNEKKWVKLGEYDDEILSIAVDSQNQILYFANHDGIYAVQLEEKNKNTTLLIPNAPPFSNTINAIYIDEKMGKVWLGVDGGITQFTKKNQQWRFFSLPRERVLALFADHNNVWFGTAYNGLGKMDCLTGNIKIIPGTPENSMVTSIIGDPIQKKIWFGLLGTRGGVYEYDMQAQTTRVLPFLDAVSTTYLLEEDDAIWAATARGAAKFSKFPGTYRDTVDPFQPQLDFGSILTLALDPKHNQLWITTEYEVITYDRTRRQNRIFTGEGGFPWSPITSSLFAAGKIWLGTEGFGLYMLNPITRMEKLADRYIISLAYDKKDKKLWVGTVYGGLSIIDIKE